LQLQRFPWLLVILCGLLSLASGAAALGMLFSPRPEGAALFGAFFAVASGGFLWMADRETFRLDGASGQAEIARSSLLRRSRVALPLREVTGFGVDSRRVRSGRNNADMELYTDVSRPVLFAADGSRHAIFRTRRGGEWAHDLARAGNDWLTAWRAAQPDPAAGQGLHSIE
jgi:hypothetical protein